jgi:hypothetical protein
MEWQALKNVNNCLNTNIYNCLETSSGKGYNLYLNDVHFFPPVLMEQHILDTSAGKQLC